MFAHIDLRKLSRITSSDQAFISVYLSGPKALKSLESRVQNTSSLLKGHRDEWQHFSENIKLVREYLKKHPLKSGGLCIFAVVIANNTSTRIFLVTSGKIDSDSGEQIRGHIKNHVRKGGWSQQRYQRRRDKELLHYAKDIVDKVVELEQKENFRRILLIGSRETLATIGKALPHHLQKKLVGEKAIDLSKGDSFIHREIFDLFFIEERRSEQQLWEQVRNAYLQGGLAVVCRSCLY